MGTVGPGNTVIHGRITVVSRVKVGFEKYAWITVH